MIGFIMTLAKISYYRLKDISNEMTFLLVAGICSLWGFIAGTLVALDSRKDDEE